MSREMSEERARGILAEHLVQSADGRDPTSFVASRFSHGWTFSAKRDLSDLSTVATGETVYLVGDAGDIMQASGSTPPRIRVETFLEHFAEPADG